MDRIGRSVQNQVVGLRNLSQAPKRSPEKRGQVAAADFPARHFKEMVMRPREDPSLKRNSRSVRAERDVVALRIDHALTLALLLADNIAEDATLLLGKPGAGGAQFVKDAPGNKRRGGNLRIGVGPFAAGQGPAIFKDGDVLET